ncbi:hypothetical protein CsSME_00041446 [Camellia sinensis var. sinensis]
MKKKNKKVSFIGVASNQGSTQDSAKAMQNVVKKNVIGSKPSAATRKNCICAPTAHAGSFRCRLHRVGVGATQKLSLMLSEYDVSERSVQSINSTNTKLHCRFGRAALAQYEHPSDLINKDEHPREVF